MQSDFFLGVIGFNGGEMGRQTKGKPSADQIVVSPLFMIITSCNGMNCFVFFFFFLRSKKQNKRPPPSKREQEKTLQKTKGDQQKIKEKQNKTEKRRRGTRKMKMVLYIL
jgi:hypothetical protein